MDSATLQVVYREDRTTCAHILNAIEDTGFEANLTLNESLQSRQMTVRCVVKCAALCTHGHNLPCAHLLNKRIFAQAAVTYIPVERRAYCIAQPSKVLNKC